MQIILLKPVQVRVSHEAHDKTSQGDFTVEEVFSKTSVHFNQISTSFFCVL